VRSKQFSPSIAPYCNAIRVGDLVLVSGTVGTDPDGKVVGGQPGRPDMGAQTDAVLDGIDHALDLLGARRDEVVKLTSYIADWRDVDQYWGTLGRRYGGLRPALSTIGQGLAQVGLAVEIEAVALCGATTQQIVLPGSVVGPYASAGVRAGDFVFLSGMAGVGRDGQVVKRGDIRAQTEQALENVRRALEQVGATPRDVVKTHTTIADWRDFDGYNELYAAFFGEPYPARASILGTLQDPDRLIEFDMLAIVGGERTYVDTGTPGRYQTKANRPNVILDDRLSPGVAPHCAAVRAGDFISISGLVATDLQGKLIGPGDIRAQTTAILDAMKLCVEPLGAGMDDVVKTLVTVTDWRHYRGYNEVYERYFNDPFPARSTIHGGLAQYGLLLEVEAFAVVGAAGSARVATCERTFWD
jgi:enamine deaminase RidA (YjgF/YER057c/UK114 family)